MSRLVCLVLVLAVSQCISLPPPYPGVDLPHSDITQIRALVATRTNEPIWTMYPGHSHLRPSVEVKTQYRDKVTGHVYEAEKFASEWRITHESWYIR